MSHTSLSGYMAPAVHTHQKEVAHPRAEWGRKAILIGCIITMAGMVTYCYGTLGAGPDADLASSVFRNGPFGWTSLLFMATGVGVWIAGNVALLGEAGRAGK